MTIIGVRYRKVVHAACGLAPALLAGCTVNTSSVLEAPRKVAAIAQPGAFLAYNFGDVRVVALLDARRPTPASIFQAPATLVADLLRAGNEATVDEEGAFARSSAIWAFVVEIEGRRILVDAGGFATIAGAGGLVPALAAAKVDTGTIDHVVISHLHVDHIGGLLDSAGKARFPKATLHLDEAEAAYWTNQSNAATAPKNEQRTFSAARRAIASYGARVHRFAGRTTIVPGFVSEPLPGHTAGHSVYRLTTANREVIFAGDMIHSLAVQMPKPDISVSFDSDPDRARAARLSFLLANATPDTLFAGPHFRSAIVKVVRSGASYRAEAVAPMP